MTDLVASLDLTAPTLTDPADITLVDEAFQQIGKFFGIGTLAARPAAGLASRMYVVNDQDTGPRLDVDTGASWFTAGGFSDKYIAGVSGPVSNALGSFVTSGNGIEFGGTNAAGDRSTIGAEHGSGLSFIAFNAEAGTNDNTYRTRGLVGSVLRGDGVGGFSWNNVPNNNADNQALVQLMTLDNTGLLTAAGVTVTAAPATADNSLKLATTSWVRAQGYGQAGAAGPPSGPAGGDLGGNYPNPSVANLGGVPAAGYALLTGAAFTGTVSSTGQIIANNLASRVTGQGNVQLIPSVGENWIESGNDVFTAAQNLGIGAPGAGQLAQLELSAARTQLDGYLAVTGGYGAVPAATGPLVLGGNGAGPNAGSLCWGDSTGWKLTFGAKVGGVFTQRFAFDDRGFFTAWNSTGASGTSAILAVLSPAAGNTGSAITASSAQPSSSAYWLYFGQVNNSTWVGGHRGDGQLFATSASVGTTSDARLKTNVRDLEAGLEVILALRPRIFDWTDEAPQAGIKGDIGFIAQEAEEHVPHLVDAVKLRQDSDVEHKTFAPGGLIPFLVNAVQELAAEVEQLKGAKA